MRVVALVELALDLKEAIKVQCYQFHHEFELY